MDKEEEKKQAKAIEVEVQSKHYRPISSEWLANGVVMVDGKPVYWKAARQYAKWEIEPSAYGGWDLGPDAREEAVDIIVRALQENRKFLTHREAEIAREKVPEEGPRISLAHGGGGTLMYELVEKLILQHISSPELDELNDGATLSRQPGRLVLTTDTYVVRPLFFRGGDIGRLAVCGTVNNISVSGAKPLAVSIGLVLEEGLPVATLSEILASISKAAKEAGVRIVAGDTKVVEKGKVDKVFVNTTGLGVTYPRMRIGLDRAKAGDVVIISGTIGDHGTAVISERENLQFKQEMESDVAPINALVEELVKAKITIKCMKDPTRGGIAAALNRIASRSGVQIELDEASIPIRDKVRDACEVLGLDPLCVPNHGKLILLCAQRSLQEALKALKRHALGKDAAVIGRVIDGVGGRVTVEKESGLRIVDMPYGEQANRMF